MRITFFFVLAAGILIGPLRAIAAEDDVLATLRKGHPRLFMHDNDFARLKSRIKTDPVAAAYFDRLTVAAGKVLDEPVARYELIGPRLLQVSRLVLGRVTLLSGLYHITGEKRYFDRARQELLAAANFQDWHPSHFLDTAEMTNAVAVGYDWLYADLSPEDRAILSRAIIEKGLKPGVVYQQRGRNAHTNTNNWNQVCNGGLTVGALAIADEDPDIARRIIDAARVNVPKAFALFAPDGGCEEGPGYWSYAMRYTAYFLAALQSALGTDFWLSQSPGLAETGLFRIYSAGPTGTFNFADAGPSIGRTAEMFWLARQYERPVYAAHERLIRQGADRIDPFHLYWFCADGSAKDIEALPLAKMFSRINVAFLRSSWDDPNAAFVGFKGGDNAASHAHADLGTFVYDVNGVRWAVDLGPDDYNLPGYFGDKRYTYYRLRTEGQNTLTFGSENQNTMKAVAPIVAFSDRRNGALAVADLTAGYTPAAKKVLRGVQLLDKALLVQDEVEAADPLNVIWNLHTAAVVEIAPNGDRATLTQGKNRLFARILQPAGARFDTISANPPPPQAQQKNITKLIVRQGEKVRSMRLLVLLSPVELASDIPVRPLQEWIDAAPVGK